MVALSFQINYPVSCVDILMMEITKTTLLPFPSLLLHQIRQTMPGKTLLWAKQGYVLGREDVPEKS